MMNNKNVNCLTFIKVVGLSLTAIVFSACGGGGAGGIGSDTCEEDSSIQSFAVAYVKRPAPTDNAGVPQSRDYRDVNNFSPGAVLYVKPQATLCSQAIDVTSREIGNTGDVKDVEISLDGTRIIFSMKEEDDNTDMDEETWNIWEYEIETDILRRIITSNIIAEAADDVDPHYLADGRIIFSSTRQIKTSQILSDEIFTNSVNKSTAAKAVQDDSVDLIFNLHVMDADGTNRRQVSFNQGHDLEPSLMDDGRILFTRWDTIGGSEFNLYTMNPDGSNTQLLYGRESHQTGSQTNPPIHFTQPREMENGNILTIIRPFDNTFDGGDIVTIDAASYVDIFTPYASSPTLTGPAQISESSKSVRTAPGISIGGRYSSAYPFWDGSGRMLVSWSACAVDYDGRLVATGQLSLCSSDNLANPTVTEVAPRYGLFVLDPGANSITPLVIPEAPVPDPNIPDAFIFYYYTDAVVAQDRSRTTNIVDQTQEGGEQTGIIHIKSVYDMGNSSTWGFFQGADSTASIEAIRDPDTAPMYANHPARFIRIVKAVFLPSTDDLNLDPSAFGVSTENGMREIVGYVPVEPDGSAKFRVPADVPIALSVLDAKGRRISQRHNHWITVRNDETIECIGCHSHSTATFNNVHGRREAEPLSRNLGAPVGGTEFTNTATTFNTDIQSGNTMAEARNPVKDTDGDGVIDDLSAIQTPTLDIVFTDVWSAGTTPALQDINLLYDDVYAVSDPKPVFSQCLTNWTDACRIIINYAEHIAPLWSRDRGAGITCIDCHTDNDGAVRGPAADLDLDDTARSPDPNAADNFLESYAELFIQDQAVNAMGMLLYIDNVTGLDTIDMMTGGLANTPKPANAPSMDTAGARASYFMQKMSGDDFGLTDRGNTVDHTGFMSDAELKVVAEWLDIGAQYFNNPFATGVPTE